MAFTVKAILFKSKQKDGKYPIAIRTTISRKISYKFTGYWCKENQFEKGQILSNYPDYKIVNRAILQEIASTERKISTELSLGNEITIETIKPKIEKSISISEFVEKIKHDYKGKFSDGILRHYQVVLNKVMEFDDKIRFSQIDVAWMESFERYLRTKKDINAHTISNNTLQNNMKILKSLLYKASELSLIDKSKFDKYKLPKYIQPIPEYLTENEINAFEKIVFALGESSLKTSGYYFLLSCYTGYRISDAKKFDYDKFVKDGQIILRAKKNKSIVSIPVHSKLKPVLKYIQTHPLNIPEQNVRDYVKDICKLAGIKKHVKYHTSRHSWAMLLMSKGFTTEEVSETLGDSVNVGRIYARISNEQLSNKIKNKLK
jgi:site-specific recombinase XerD